MLSLAHGAYLMTQTTLTHLLIKLCGRWKQYALISVRMVSQA